MRRGLVSGLWCVALLAVSTLPSRLASVMHGRAALWEKAVRIFAGAILDLSAVIAVLVPIIWLLAVLPGVLFKPRAKWQQLAAPLLSLPICFAVYLLAITAQEVKSERGAFPTMFDLAEGGGNASFVGGALGFIRLDRIWVPLIVFLVLTATVLFFAVRWARRSAQPEPKAAWVFGLSGGLGLGIGALFVLAQLQAAVANRTSPAALGDPLTGIVESSFDMLQHRSAATPRELTLEVELPAGSSALGATRIGWPRANAMTPIAGATCFHPRARPLGADPGASGHALITALEAVSKALFTNGDGRIAMFELSLESFRADDVHALNPLAPVEIDPFTTGLYDAAHRGGGEGVLASSKMYQAGVRTAQGLGALTCGIGTLPYNLSIIRDLQPFALRCAGDVLHDAGFGASFYYGSDATFDQMDQFLKSHGVTKLVSQVELPKNLPKGAWDGVTDLAVFHEAVQAMAQSVETGPQFSFVMSLSNHSPYTPPEDLPAAVTERVDRALKTASHRAESDDRRRLLTHSYTDAAVEKFFAELSTTNLAERSIVLLSADHSTGENYIWGMGDPETDDAKARIPFAIVIPPAFMARVSDRVALVKALEEAQRQLEAAPISQNDVPAMILALVSANPAITAMPASAKWHTLGGQRTSATFAPGGDERSFIIGINGVSEFFTLDREGTRVGGYEDSVFLKTRADRYRVTPRLIPVAATLAETLRWSCQPSSAR